VIRPSEVSQEQIIRLDARNAELRIRNPYSQIVAEGYYIARQMDNNAARATTHRVSFERGATGAKEKGRARSPAFFNGS
jgi:hypothetical protein